MATLFLWSYKIYFHILSLVYIFCNKAKQPSQQSSYFFNLYFTCYAQLREPWAFIKREIISKIIS